MFCVNIYITCTYNLFNEFKQGDSNTSRAAAEEARIAESAASGVEVTTYGVGEKPKKKRHEDPQDRIDALAVSMEKDSAMMSNAMNSIISNFSAGRGNAESPRTKKARHYTSICKRIALLTQEKARFVALGMDTTDADQQITRLQNERRLIDQARASGTNLVGEFNAAA